MAHAYTLVVRAWRTLALAWICKPCAQLVSSRISGCWFSGKRGTRQRLHFETGLSSHRRQLKGTFGPAPSKMSIPNSTTSISQEWTNAAGIRVAVFEQTPMSCELMARALESSPYNIRVVAAGLSAEFDGESQLNGSNVVVIGSSLQNGHLTGFTLLRRLTKANRGLNCVLLIDRDDRELVIEAFRSGAVGICERGQSCDQLCKCIACVNQGQIWASNHQKRWALEALSNGLPPFITDARGEVILTRREHEIVSGVAEGMKNREIAELLHVSENTVKNHMFRIFERLGISSRAELVLYLLGQRIDRWPC